MRGSLGVAVLAAALLGAAPGHPDAKAAATVDEARAFAAAAEERLGELTMKASRAQWVQSTFITDDTEELAAQATRFDGLALPEDVARKLKLLKVSLTLPAPSDPKSQTELTETAAW